MPNTKKFWSFWLPLTIGLFDLFWAYSALSPTQGSNPASSVSMVNSAVWIFLHVPALMLGSLPFEGGPSSAAVVMPKSELFLIGVLGIAQMAALGWWIGRYLDKKRKV